MAYHVYGGPTDGFLTGVFKLWISKFTQHQYFHLAQLLLNTYPKCLHLFFHLLRRSKTFHILNCIHWRRIQQVIENTISTFHRYILDNTDVK